MRSPLTPRRGYVVTLSQVEGGRPRLSVGCQACHFLTDVTVTNLEAATPRDLGAILRAALDAWQEHMCEATSSSGRTSA